MEFKKAIFGILTTLFAKLIKTSLTLLMKTCTVEVKGIDHLRQASTGKCMLALWHNRMAPVISILKKYTPKTNYMAIVSASKDGDILSKMIQAYPTGFTLRVPHLSRYTALRQMIEKIEEKKHVLVITPDGPRGPCYDIKPGIAIAALETGAQVIPFTWSANRYWELKTWDKFRIPKPFSKVHVYFGSPLQFRDQTLEEVKAILKKKMDAIT